MRKTGHSLRQGRGARDSGFVGATRAHCAEGESCWHAASGLRRTVSHWRVFDEQKPESLINAVEMFERHRNRFDPERIRAHVEPFDRKYFQENVLRQLIESSWEDFRRTRLC